jgi:hypothetical protein
MKAEAKRPRWLSLQFSLRTLFIVVTLFAIWLGWQLQRIKARKDAIERIESNGGIVQVGPSFTFTNQPPPEISWFRVLLGDQAVTTIGMPDQFSTRERERICSQFPEATCYEAKDGSIFFRVPASAPVLSPTLPLPGYEVTLPNRDLPPQEEYPGRIEALELQGFGDLHSR